MFPLAQMHQIRMADIDSNYNTQVTGDSPLGNDVAEECTKELSLECYVIIVSYVVR